MQSACSLLLVDDDEEFLEIVNRRFMRRGLATAAVGNPDAALEAVQGRKFHVAVVDRTLPGEDGIDLMVKLKAHAPDIQVIILSGHSDERGIAQAQQAGAFEYLVKPCSLAELETAVTRACETMLKSGT